MKHLFLSCILLMSGLAVLGQTNDVKKFANESEVPRMTIEDAKKAFDNGDAVFVDARAVDIFRQEHIKGAVNIPSGSDDKFDSLPKGKKMIIYCS